MSTSPLTLEDIHEAVVEAIARKLPVPAPVVHEPELSVLDVLSGDVSWDELHAYRLAG